MLHVLQVLLACVEVVLVLAAVVPAITDKLGGHLLFLDDPCLLSKKFDSSVHFDLVAGLASENPSNIAPPALLDEHCLSFDVVVAPLVPEHAPVRLDAQRCQSLLLSLLLSLTTISTINYISRA